MWRRPKIRGEPRYSIQLSNTPIFWCDQCSVFPYCQFHFDRFHKNKILKGFVFPWASWLGLRYPLFVVRNDLMGRYSDDTAKTQAPFHNRCGQVKIPPCSKAVIDEHRSAVSSPSPTMMPWPVFVVFPPCRFYLDYT